MIVEPRRATSRSRAQASPPLRRAEWLDPARRRSPERTVWLDGPARHTLDRRARLARVGTAI